MLKIGDLAQRTGVSADALRLYERRGLIRSERMANGYRVFDPEMERLVKLIRLGQSIGFTLREMEHVIATLSSRDLSAAQTATLIQDRIDAVDVKLAELTELRRLLVDLQDQACPLRG
ncbi:transcriptional regulator, MerR family [Ruegeria sp. TM1040]|uniref:MerR family DNA-binding transcriptional regulator n=1 Tax=Ruegeria sp. (strain TM1040) TaxID=292414 RepID=UPI0000462F76|nr:MerR family DNA-binding transcriptional regulator [Ruegeria sp. TM1040]ABF64813.1 transcriptional regulator, MerR family [Ruegeria sp. TM1040]